MFSKYCGFGVLLLLVTLSVVTVKCVTITTKVPEVFEAGKPATIECDVVYNEIEDVKLTTLYYMENNGKPIKIGDSSSGITSNPVNDRTTISIKFDKVKIVFNKLQYNDKFVFVCEGLGIAKGAGWERDIKNASIAIQNVQGGVTNCGPFSIKAVYQLPERNGSQYISVTLCGSPPPRLSYSVDGGVNFTDTKKLFKLYNNVYVFKVIFTTLNRESCGNDIHFKATGFKSWNSTSKLIVNHQPFPLKNFVNFVATKFITVELKKCLLFKFEPQVKSKCRNEYAVYAYNSSFDLVKTFTNISNDEKQFCEDVDGPDFHNIVFVKSQVFWMKSQSGLSESFLAVYNEVVKPINLLQAILKTPVEDQRRMISSSVLRVNCYQQGSEGSCVRVPVSSERAQSDHDIVYLTDPLALAGIFLVFVICVQSIVLVVYGCRYKRSRSQKKKRHSTHYEIDPLDLTDGEEDGSQSNNNRQNNSNYDYPYTHFNKTQQRHRSRGRNDTRDYDDIIPSSTFEEGVTLVTKSDDTAQYMEIADI